MKRAIDNKQEEGDAKRARDEPDIYDDNGKFDWDAIRVHFDMEADEDGTIDVHGLIHLLVYLGIEPDAAHSFDPDYNCSAFFDDDGNPTGERVGFSDFKDMTPDDYWPEQERDETAKEEFDKVAKKKTISVTQARELLKKLSNHPEDADARLDAKKEGYRMAFADFDLLLDYCQ